MASNRHPGQRVPALGAGWLGSVRCAGWWGRGALGASWLLVPGLSHHPLGMRRFAAYSEAYAYAKGAAIGASQLPDSEFVALLRRVLLPLDEILRLPEATSTTASPGVYFLIDCDETIMYVGKSSCSVRSRIEQARRWKLPFVRATFLACDRADVTVLEAAYIRLCDPPFNIEGRNVNRRARRKPPPPPEPRNRRGGWHFQG
jgi:hypothetical protein